MPNLALGIQVPKLDMAGDMRAGQQVKAGEMSNQLEALNVQDKTGQANALEAYRGAAKAGDPNAINKLTGYPDIQLQIHKALDGMKPDKAQAAIDKGNAFGTAAQYVGRFAAGSPEQLAAWGKVITDLQSAGHIDKATADFWKKSGPSDVLIQQAQTVGEAVKSYQQQQVESQLTTADLLKVEQQTTTFQQHYFPTGMLTIDDNQIKQRDAAVAAYRQQLVNTLVASLPKAKGIGAPAPAAPKSNVLNLTPKPVTGGLGAAPAAPAAKPAPALGTLPAPTRAGSLDIYNPTPIDQQGGTKAAAPAPLPTASLKDWKPGAALPASHADAVQLKGTAAEQRAQLKALPDWTPFVDANGVPGYRKPGGG